MKDQDYLVSGSHRSGTTWTAKVLAAHPEINYIAEPFNPSFEHPGNPVKYWYHYLREFEEYPKFYRYINSKLNFNLYGVLNELQQGIRKGYHRAYVKNQIDKLIHPYGLVKDPIALFSVPWLARRFRLKVIVLIRHPAAFAASLKVKDWHFDFNQLSDQEELMKDILWPFESELRNYQYQKHSIIDQAILLWNIFYYTVDQYREKYPYWYFVKQEDLSKEPTIEFEKIMAYMGLSMHPDVSRMIAITTTGMIPKDGTRSTKGDNIYRVSSEDIYSWKTRLSRKEILNIRKGTEDIADRHYDESDW